MRNPTRREENASPVLESAYVETLLFPARRIHHLRLSRHGSIPVTVIRLFDVLKIPLLAPMRVPEVLFQPFPILGFGQADDLRVLPDRLFYPLFQRSTGDWKVVKLLADRVAQLAHRTIPNLDRKTS